MCVCVHVCVCVCVCVAVASMDASGKIIWARHNEIQMVNVKSATEFVDGERLPLAVKEVHTEAPASPT